MKMLINYGGMHMNINQIDMKRFFSFSKINQKTFIRTCEIVIVKNINILMLHAKEAGIEREKEYKKVPFFTCLALLFV
jgi:hypothetical protein